MPPCPCWAVTHACLHIWISIISIPNRLRLPFCLFCFTSSRVTTFYSSFLSRTGCCCCFVACGFGACNLCLVPCPFQSNGSGNLLSCSHHFCAVSEPLLGLLSWGIHIFIICSFWVYSALIILIIFICHYLILFIFVMLCPSIVAILLPLW